MKIEPFAPHPYEQIAEGVLPTPVAPEIYAGWVRKFERGTDSETYRLTYESGGETVTGVMMRPADAETHPLVIFNRGGRGRYGMLNVLTINNLLQPLVAKGYLVLASNYRGTDGGTGRDGMGGEEVQDILHLIALGRALPQWDGRNIYMFGWSRGGMMTMLALKHGAQVNAVAVGAGLFDWNLWKPSGDTPEAQEARLKQILPDYEALGKQALINRSAVEWPEAVTAPTLLMHGTADDVTTPEHSRRLAEGLRRAGTPVELVEYPGGNHYLNREREQVMEAVDGWFTRYRCQAS